MNIIYKFMIEINPKWTNCTIKNTMINLCKIYIVNIFITLYPLLSNSHTTHIQKPNHTLLHFRLLNKFQKINTFTKYVHFICVWIFCSFYFLIHICFLKINLVKLRRMCPWFQTHFWNFIAAYSPIPETKSNWNLI